MSILNPACTGSRRRFPVVTATILLSMSFVAMTLSAADDTQMVQTLQSIDLGATPNAANIQILGATPGDHLSGSEGTFSTLPRAHAIATGDFNDDGRLDVVVGASDADFTPPVGAARVNAGAVYVLFGRATFASPTIVDTNLTAISQPDVKVFGAATGDNLGFVVAAGDVNGDGFDDLVMGAPGFDLMPGPPVVDRPNAGAVYILFGSSTFTGNTIDLSIPNVANVLVIGEQTGDRFGSAIAIGDVNSGISSPDLLVGAPASKGPDPVGTPRTDGGAAYLLFGGPGLANAGATTRTIDVQQPGTLALIRVYGKTESRLGSSADIGDVNSGGAADLVLGAPTADRPEMAGDVNETGAVFVVFGGTNLTPTPPATIRTFDINTSQQSVSFYGASASDRLGASVATGDVNNDGTTDITIGAPDADGPSDLRMDAGEAYVALGGPALTPGLRVDVSLTTVALTVFGAAAGNHLGADVAAGVVNTMGNTDTIPDVIIGSPGALSSKGTVSILFGGPSLLVVSTRDVALGQDDIRIIGQAAGDELGWAIATGDIDNNGGGDLAIGAPFNDVTVGATRMDAGKAYVLLAASDVVPPMNQNPSVTVTAPNGGETLPGGSTFQITWTASDPDGDGTLQRFEIRLSTDGGATFNTIITSSVVGTARSFSWTVPAGINTVTARIRVIAFDDEGGQAQDDSNNNFAITDVGVPVAILTPNGGETLRFSQSFNITWVVGTGFEAQVKGFDLFFTTDNGLTFTAITPVNPTQPALGPDVRQFTWTVPSICTNSAKVTVRATSITNAVSSDSSNAAFTINQPAPQIDPNEMYFSKGNKRINIFILPNTQPLFLDGVRLEISTDQTGTSFVMVPDVVVKQGANKIQSTSRMQGVRIGVFFPDGAIRMLRITQQTCGIVLLRVRRSGQDILLEPAAAEAGSLPN